MPTPVHTSALRLSHPSFQHIFKERAPALRQVFRSALTDSLPGASGVYSSNTSPAQAQDEDIYPRRLRQLLGRGWVTVHGPEFRKKPFSWHKCLSGVGGSLTRLAPGAAAVPRPAGPSPTPAGVKLAAGGGTGHPAGSAPPPGFLGADSHGYREIFISIRWAPGYRGGHAATDGKPSQPGDKDRPATHRERLQRLPGCAPAGKARRGAPETPGTPAGGRDPEPAPGGGRTGPHSPPGGGSGSSRSLASRCH